MFFSLFALKGQNRPDQGNALGRRNNIYFYALKGQNKNITIHTLSFVPFIRFQ